MNWQELMEQIYEINDLQLQLLIHLQSPIIKQITERNNKYGSKLLSELMALNNAVLEHKIRITPYQTIILHKINELYLDTSQQSIYANMPESLEEATKYITNLKEKFKLAVNAFDLVIALEELSSIEYITNEEFSKSTYARKVQIENEIYLKYLPEIGQITENDFLNTITNKQKEFMDKLSHEEKKKLFVETFALSYDRNAFEYFNEEKVAMTRAISKNYNPHQIMLLIRQYESYKMFLINANKMFLSKKSLQEIINEFKIIYETELYKQKIIKK